MQTNNAEVITEQSNESTAVAEDTTSTTDVNAIEAGDTATGEESSSVEGEEQSSTESDLYYDIDGEEVSASMVKEWKKGHMLQSDYTKKSQANAEMRKSLEAKMADYDGVKTKLSDYVTELEAIIQKESNPEELAELREEDYVEYSRRKEEIAEKQKLSEKAKKELADLKAKEQKDKIAEEAKLLIEVLPDWQDPAKLKADQALIDEYASANQFTDDDVNSLISHKLMKMANDAAKYHKLQKESGEVEKQVQKAPNVVKGRPKEKQPTTTREQRFYGN